MTKIDILVNFRPKIKIFSKILTKFQILEQFAPQAIFSKILMKIGIFRKFWPKSRYLQILTQVDIFRKFWL